MLLPTLAPAPASWINEVLFNDGLGTKQSTKAPTDLLRLFFLSFVGTTSHPVEAPSYHTIHVMHASAHTRAKHRRQLDLIKFELGDRPCHPVKPIKTMAAR